MLIYKYIYTEAPDRHCRQDRRVLDTAQQSRGGAEAARAPLGARYSLYLLYWYQTYTNTDAVGAG